MGYTHYWTFKPIPRGQAKLIEQRYQLAVRQCTRVIQVYNKQFPKGDDRRLSGFSAHVKIGEYGGINFNGCLHNAHETFTMREHYKQNLEHSDNFCKTGRTPYDAVVVACLCIMKHYLGDLFEVASDGYMQDWFEGFFLAKRILRMINIQIPLNIKYNWN